MPDLDRRSLLRYGAAVAVVTATAGGVQSLAAPGSAAGVPPPEKDRRDFHTRHGNKDIKGVHDKKTKKHKVTINDRKLAVVEIELPAPDGKPGTVIAVISALTHFEPFLLDDGENSDGLLKMAKKAVDTLGDAELTALAGQEHDHGR